MAVYCCRDRVAVNELCILNRIFPLQYWTIGASQAFMSSIFKSTTQYNMINKIMPRSSQRFVNGSKMSENCYQYEDSDIKTILQQTISNVRELSSPYKPEDTDAKS